MLKNTIKKMVREFNEKKIKNSTKYLLFFILFVFIILFPFHFSFEKAYLAYPVPHKTNIGASDTILEYPWGNKSNLTVYVDLDNVSIENRSYYFDAAQIALKWWEKDTTHNLSYSINFTISNNSADSNIIFRWNETLYGSRNVLGHTHINSSENLEEFKKCDTFNPPYTQCNITILTNLTYEENLHVIKHEIGHALGLEHSFNKSDFLLLFFGFNPNYLLSPSEIMFDDVVYLDVYKLLVRILKIELLFVGIIAAASFFITYLTKYKKYVEK